MNAAEAFVERLIRRLERRRDDGRAARGVADLADRDRRGASDQEMTKGDEVMERVADRAQATAERLAHEDGLKAKLAQPLAEDAEFLRKLKPSLMKARAKGEAPTDEKPGTPHVAPSGPQLGKRPKPRGGGGPN